MRVAIANLGLGNLRSVERAILRAAAETKLPMEALVTSDPDALRRADKIVVPGQGAFGAAASTLGAGIGQALREEIAAGKPYLGICLGLQLLFGSSDENPGARGLGIFPGSVTHLPREGVKTPHMGWNTVEPGGDRSLLPKDPTYFYFTHSYIVVPEEASLAAGTTEYGSTRFVSAVARGNLFACQFHPEKSQRAGLALLVRFLGL